MLPSGCYLTGTDDYLIFIGNENLVHQEPPILYSYNVKTRETRLLYDGGEMDVYTAVTDGTWFYTNIPWGGRTDCWKLIYDYAGNLIGLELFEADI
jgi:hypothetical protein